jgi:hypothetical protein
MARSPFDSGFLVDTNVRGSTTGKLRASILRLRGEVITRHRPADYCSTHDAHLAQITDTGAEEQAITGISLATGVTSDNAGLVTPMPDPNARKRDLDLTAIRPSRASHTHQGG